MYTRSMYFSDGSGHNTTGSTSSGPSVGGAGNKNGCPVFDTSCPAGCAAIDVMGCLSCTCTGIHYPPWGRFRKYRQLGGGGADNMFYSSTYFAEGLTNLPRDTIGPGSIPVFLRKPRANCDFPEGFVDPLSPIWSRPCYTCTSFLH